MLTNVCICEADVCRAVVIIIIISNSSYSRISPWKATKSPLNVTRGANADAGLDQAISRSPLLPPHWMTGRSNEKEARRTCRRTSGAVKYNQDEGVSPARGRRQYVSRHRWSAKLNPRRPAGGPRVSGRETSGLIGLATLTRGCQNFKWP